MKDGLYFLHPEGSAWIGAIFKNSKLVTTIQECDVATHACARDELAGIYPEDSDIELDKDKSEEIIKKVMGENTFPEMVYVTRPVEYILIMSDGTCSHEVIFLEEPEKVDIYSEIKEWCENGEWGDNGAAIDVSWKLKFEEEEIDSGFHTVDIEPNHSSLIAKACRNTEYCGNNPEDHDWTAEGEGGCDENPGVWSLGGTAMAFYTHCRKCGLERQERITGSQRNPGEHDTVGYVMPNN